jgi:quercetin dioxygenase-like cupin family protein
MENLPMNFPRIHSDDQGETHFGVQEIPDFEVPFGPPPNPKGAKADFGAVESMFVFAVPAGTDVPAHNAPQPYIAIIMSGEAEVVASDGDTKRFHPGELLLCDDLTGKGHVTRAISNAVVAFVNRAGP